MFAISRTRLVISSLFVISGFVVYFVPVWIAWKLLSLGPWASWLPIVIVFGAAALIGAGVGNLFRRMRLGALCGVLLYLVFCIARLAVLGPDGLKRQAANQIAEQISQVIPSEKGFKIEGNEAVYRGFNTSVGEIRHKLPDADAKTFHAFTQPRDAFALYAVDSNHVYMAEQDTVFKLDNIDAKTFQLLDPRGFFTKDSQRVYFRGAPLLKSDPQTFEVLEYPFGKDKNAAYIGIVPIPVADIASWEPLQKGSPDDPWEHVPDRLRPVSKLVLMGWSRDRKHLYWGNKIVPEADPATFRLLLTAADRKSPFMAGFYGKDKDHVFYSDQIISGADPKSFEVDDPRVGPWDAHDAEHRYSSGKIYSR
jgi:DKNYY family